jgi:hypothetical protein
MREIFAALGLEGDFWDPARPPADEEEGRDRSDGG